MDTFDYKPALDRLHGRTPPQGAQGFMGRVGRLHKAHFTFRQRGRSGLWISDLFPHLAELADELTVIRSMWSGTGNHTPATRLRGRQPELPRHARYAPLAGFVELV